MAKLQSVLIVDDSDKCIELMKLSLEACGAPEVASERKPEAAIRRIGSGAYDLVLLDIKMPGMSGLQVLEAVRGANMFAPILIVSGSIRETDVTGAYERGCNGYFGKPDTLDGYRTLARTVMDYWRHGDVPMRH